MIQPPKTADTPDTQDTADTKTAHVIDPASLMRWYLTDHGEEDNEDLQVPSFLQILTKGPNLAPHSFWFELRNMLLDAERAHRIDAAETAGILEDLADLPLRLEPPGDSDHCLALARKHQLSASEAATLELAMKNGAAIISPNSTLNQAARSEGLETRASGLA